MFGDEVEEVDEEEPAGSQTQKSHMENYSSSALFNNPRSQLDKSPRAAYSSFDRMKMESKGGRHGATQNVSVNQISTIQGNVKQVHSSIDTPNFDTGTNNPRMTHSSLEQENVP